MIQKPSSQIQVGMNGRFFPKNWRPALEEIAFARNNGFEAVQFPGPTAGLGLERLGSDLDTIAAALDDAGLTAVMEMVIQVYDNGLTEGGQSPLDVLRANLPAIITLPCPRVHWHLVSRGTLADEPIRQLEKSFLPQFREAVEIADKHQFKFGFEHNEPELMLFSKPEACQELLEGVPGLGFVWDFNHTTEKRPPAFQAFIPRMSMLHVSDTLLPEVNFHLPLGMGNVDMEGYCQALLAGGFSGPAILEIGGLPKSGGYGRDTNEALIDSKQRLEAAIFRANGHAL